MMSTRPEKPPASGGGNEGKSGLRGLTEIKEPGWKKGDSTALFRAINPELFVKPVSTTQIHSTSIVRIYFLMFHNLNATVAIFL